VLGGVLMRLPRRVLLFLVSAGLAVAVFVVVGLSANGSIFIPIEDEIIGATIAAVIIGALLTEAMRFSPQNQDAKTAGTDILTHSEQSAGTLPKIIELLTSDSSISRIAGLHSLRSIGRLSDETSSAARDILEAFIRQAAVPEEPRASDRRIELELAISYWASLAKSQLQVERPLDLSGLVLDYLRLTNLSLVGANLANASLVEANIAGSDLDGANFSKAFLGRCNCTGTRFKLATFSQADLRGALLADADMSGAMLREANMSQASAQRTNLARALLARANLDDADLTLADLTGAMLVDSSLHGATLTGAKLAGAAISVNADSSSLGNEELPADVSVVRNEKDLENWLMRRAALANG
jgi:uncharacterized protein YjbI with pentapeptide repeats